MAPDLLQRRLVRCIQPTRPRAEKFFRPTLTLVDIAHWLDLPDASPLYQFARNLRPIRGEWQVRLSQMFTLIDEGRLVLRVQGRRKTLERVDPELAQPPCKVARPRIDFADGKLKFD